jgi:hypothetical protein
MKMRAGMTSKKCKQGIGKTATFLIPFREE